MLQHIVRGSFAAAALYTAPEVAGDLCCALTSNIENPWLKGALNIVSYIYLNGIFSGIVGGVAGSAESIFRRNFDDAPIFGAVIGFSVGWVHGVLTFPSFLDQGCPSRN
ncbi:MAG: hypothetical protein FJZ64_02945 [Chlamydiae bacterium]|nr:hypothetical protein [Chlamydiota bacterium]